MTDDTQDEMAGAIGQVINQIYVPLLDSQTIIVTAILDRLVESGVFNRTDLEAVFARADEMVELWDTGGSDITANIIESIRHQVLGVPDENEIVDEDD